MIIKRFALYFVFALLAAAGETGVRCEVIHHEEEHCLICVNLARSESKSVPFCACLRYGKPALKRQIIQNANVKQDVHCAQCCPDNIQGNSQFRILLI
jgi:hypothetical protein